MDENPKTDGSRATGYTIEMKTAPAGNWERFGPHWEDRDEVIRQAQKLVQLVQHETLASKCSAIRVVADDRETIWSWAALAVEPARVTHQYERFTERARKVMQLANREAQRYKHEYIGTEHILLGLLKEGSGVAVAALRNLGFESERIAFEIERLIQEASAAHLGDPLPQTPRAKKVIERAMQDARDLHHDHVGTEHILLGLLREDEGVAAQALKIFGVRLERILAEIQAILQRSSESGGSDQYSSHSRIHGIEDRPKFVEKPPATCPKCGDPHIVRVLWNCLYFSAQIQKDVDAGRVILSAYSEMAGPPWVCLRCSPGWSEVHALGMQHFRLQLAKENAILAEDFHTAAKCRDDQVELRRQCSQTVEELLKNQ